MTAAEDLPESLYARILGQISDVIRVLNQDTQEDKLSGKQDAARQHLQSIERDLDQSIEELRRNAEWKTFTLAFYGETNAGKSTLIESLRILLKESSKTQQREKFRALQKQLGVSESNLQELELQIETLSGQLAQLDSEFSATTERYDQQQTQLDQHATELRQRIETLKSSAGFIQRILNLFRKLPEEQDLQKIQQQARQLLRQREAELQDLQQRRNETQQQRETYSNRHQTALTDLQQLEPFEDGGIIGDGRSDFTRETHPYTFEVAGQPFMILDVPGIEGDEVKVSEQISKAVKRAHAVFYVTGKAAPPQTGDEGRPGTLEKIKAHLNDQTEVWTLFNKRITNPLALQKPILISDDEQASLADLDNKMREQLGDNYQRSLSLCALPAFLAAADCLTPRSSKAASRKKFLDALPPDQLLEKSGLKSFYRHLTQDLVKDYKVKIKRANMNKVGVAIENVCAVMDRLRRDQFLPLTDDLRKTAANANKQLDMALGTLRSQLIDEGERAIGKFEENVRQKIYARIERNISNDDFRSSLRSIMEDEQKVLQADLPKQLDEKVSQFQKQTAEIVERYQQHANDLLTSYENLRKTRLSSDFTPNVNIDNGINAYGLLAGLAGGALMIWNPMGWVLMTLGAITLLTGLAKSVWGFFDNDYKKGQQRKSAEENLDKACDEIRTSLRQSLDEAIPTLEKTIGEIREMLQAPVRQAQQISNKLDSAHLHLKQLASNLKTEGMH
ncbi:hypothetical protein AAER22_13070 [Pseudomonas aeruginosa]|uniref:Dynamin family protein n=1 Tax=Pseudomonas aeruginosa TaxID=287 RepID=A0A367MCM8_PSEAI|nr:hypothetical protein [Pseudomonas aeruginosa]EKS2405591.1 hypothetical protein [Pseudomonas aeruginosa]EKW2497783.1 hypothetical protein [Pseudomonas aeruginosa]EKW4464451.1 hypothetical protein [Pseudomonas aeruginosa]EKX1099495.1 hypothetical protein [Pseudomonas aeruginosa]EKX4038396.1 hypothetical protein [Pseudomonas aeruginosa]